MGDYRTTTGEALPLSKRQRRVRLMLYLSTAIVAAAVAITAGTLITVERYVPATGYVTTEDYAEVRPGVAGLVAEIMVRSGADVQKGDILVQLDNSEEVATFEEARSRVHQTEAEVRRRRAEGDELKRRLEEDIAIARLRLKNAGANLVRTQELLSRGLIAGSALDDNKLKEELARAELASLLNRDLSIYDKDLDVLEQELEARREAVRRAQARARTKEVRAPIAGKVLRYEFVIGELVRPETVLYEIFGGDEKVLKLRVGERYSVKVAKDQRYSARLAPYRGTALQRIYFDGYVESLRSVIQSEGQKTYRVAYCTFDDRGMDVPPGTSAEARIYYGRASIWAYLLGWE